MSELYDHGGDDGGSMDGGYEATNLIGRANASLVLSLDSLLRSSFPGSRGPPGECVRVNDCVSE